MYSESQGGLAHLKGFIPLLSTLMRIQDVIHGPYPEIFLSRILEPAKAQNFFFLKSPF